jgi:divalent metal cation (Fe/Co/Zn/Cd) transporter
MTDHVHYQTDVLLNISVIAALLLDQMLGWRLADPLFGFAIAGWLMYGAWSAASHSVDQLMDREWPMDEREAFLTAAQDYPELAGLHDLGWDFGAHRCPVPRVGAGRLDGGRSARADGQRRGEAPAPFPRD